MHLKGQRQITIHKREQVRTNEDCIHLSEDLSRNKWLLRNTRQVRNVSHLRRVPHLPSSDRGSFSTCLIKQVWTFSEDEELLNLSVYLISVSHYHLYFSANQQVATNVYPSFYTWFEFWNWLSHNATLYSHSLKHLKLNMVHRSLSNSIV